MEGSFAIAYGRLNAAQKEAVDNIDGPMLVIAGPGTGKTQLLSLRVASILKETDITEENILCLTFTESAVNEMSNRLNKIIGPSASKITIDTYHGFGSNLIRQYPLYFSAFNALEPAGVLLVNKQLREIISKLSISNQFKNTTDLRDIKRLISDFKKAALMPSDVAKLAKENLEFIDQMAKLTRPLTSHFAVVSKGALDYYRQLIVPDTKQAKDSLSSIWNDELTLALDECDETNSLKPLSAWKRKFMVRDSDDLLIPAGTEQNKRLLDFCEVYELYLKQMDLIGRFDFDDMILKSIEALKKYPDLKYTLAEQYQYILLDEYQDTNEAQAKLIELLCDHPVNEGRPNVMAVGDDDQAIYAFQGASHSHMYNFYLRYKDVRLITLKTNYRSGQGLIDLSTSVANQIDTRLTSQIKGITKLFNSAKKDKGTVLVVNADTQANEFNWIASSIKERSKKVSYSEIAVLAPKHKYLETLSSYLQSMKIPINYEKREDVLSDPVISQVIQIARLINSLAEGNVKLSNSLLADVLNYDFWQLNISEVWKLAWESRSTSKDWISLMLTNDHFKQIALFFIKLSSSSLSERFDLLLDQILGLSEVKIKDKKNISFTSPLYSFYKKDQSLMLSTFSAMLRIRNEFIDYSEGNNGPLRLKDYLNFIDLYENSELTMINSSPYIDSDDSVKLMTAYKAKGQEFDSVYMLSAIDGVWGPSARGKADRISLPPNLKYVRSQSLVTDDDKLRLIYVTLSRAKNNLVISSFAKNDSGNETKEIQYFAEAETAKQLSKAKMVNADPKQIKNSSLITYYQSNHSVLLQNANNREVLKTRLESYKLSPTDLNTFINVMYAGPEVFLNQVLLNYPKPDTMELIYGNAIHKTLDFIQRYLTTNTKVPSLKEINSEYTAQLKLYHLTSQEFKDQNEKGRQALEVYYKQNKDLLKAGDLSEISFHAEGVVINDAKLHGNIDKLIIDQDNMSLVIADYKTGAPHKSWEKKVTVHLNQNQLYFYKLLVNNSKKFKKYNATKAYLHFISSKEDIKNILMLDFDEAREEQIKQLITAVWQHINDLNFPDISVYPKSFKGLIAFEDDLIKGKI